MTLDDRMTISTPEGVDLEVRLAGLGSRYLAILLDLAIIVTAGSILLWIVLMVGVAAGSAAVLFGLLSLVTFLLLFGYNLSWELLTGGRTPGKMAAGIRVVRVGGGRVTALPAIVRSVTWVFEVIALPLVAIAACFVSPRNQRLGDMAAGTVVVRERFAPGAFPAVLQPAAYAPDAPFLLWDVSGVTSDEIVVVRRFLERRGTLVPGARWSIGCDLAARLRPRVAGVPAAWHDEAFLECLVAAKAIRGS